MSTANPQDDRLQQRIIARNRAAEVLDIAEGECRDMSPQAFASYWEEIRNRSMEIVPLPEPAPKLIKATPMTDTECREFEKEEVPFREFGRARVGQVPMESLRRVSAYDFVEKLQRYLANETIARSFTN